MPHTCPRTWRGRGWQRSLSICQDQSMWAVGWSLPFSSDVHREEGAHGGQPIIALHFLDKSPLTTGRK